MELYHIHRINKHDNYHEGRILYPGTAFNSMHETFLGMSSSIPAATKTINGKAIDFMARFDKYLEKKIERDNISPEELKEILWFARAYAANSSINTREMILEEVRRESYPTLPSRYKCIWLTDEEGIEFWIPEIIKKDGKYEIYKVNADGNLFLSTNTLLPDCYLKNKAMYEQAHKYWNPNPEYLKTAKDKEYLFEGELKLIKKIK